MKKTLLITSLFPPMHGGVQNHLWNLYRRLPADKLIVLAGHDIDSKAEDEFDHAAEPLHIVRTDFTRQGMLPSWIAIARVARQLIRKHHIEQIVCGEILPSGAAGLLLGNKPSVLMTYGRDLVLPRTSPLKHLLARHVLRASAQIITISEFTRGLIQSYGDFSAHTILMPPGVDADRFSPRATKDATLLDRYGLRGKKILVSIGRLDRRKGFDTLIALMPEIVQRVPNAHYLIVGQGDDHDYLSNLIARHAMQPHVTLVKERIPNESLATHYALADVFVTLSRDIAHEGNVEGFGMVFLEANACGVPVVAGNTGGVADAVADGVTGYLVDPTDGPTITEKISSLLEDPDRAREMGEAGRRRAVTQFNWDTKATELERILSSL